MGGPKCIFIATIRVQVLVKTAKLGQTKVENILKGINEIRKLIFNNNHKIINITII